MSSLAGSLTPASRLHLDREEPRAAARARDQQTVADRPAEAAVVGLELVLRRVEAQQRERLGQQHDRSLAPLCRRRGRRRASRASGTTSRCDRGSRAALVSTGARARRAGARGARTAPSARSRPPPPVVESARRDDRSARRAAGAGDGRGTAAMRGRLRALRLLLPYADCATASAGALLFLSVLFSGAFSRAPRVASAGAGESVPIVAVSVMPSALAVAIVRSQLAPLPNGPRSITGTVSSRPL